jgi:hypothetical protein
VTVCPRRHRQVARETAPGDVPVAWRGSKIFGPMAPAKDGRRHEPSEGGGLIFAQETPRKRKPSRGCVGEPRRGFLRRAPVDSRAARSINRRHWRPPRLPFPRDPPGGPHVNAQAVAHLHPRCRAQHRERLQAVEKADYRCAMQTWELNVELHKRAVPGRSIARGRWRDGLNRKQRAVAAGAAPRAILPSGAIPRPGNMLTIDTIDGTVAPEFRCARLRIPKQCKLSILVGEVSARLACLVVDCLQSSTPSILSSS